MADDAGGQVMSDPVDVIIDKLLRYVMFRPIQRRNRGIPNAC